MCSVSKLQLIILLGGFYLVEKIYCQDPAIAQLTTRVTTVNNTAMANKNAIASLTTRFNTFQNQYYAEYEDVNQRIYAITMNLTTVYGTLDQHTAAISALSLALDEANSKITAANELIAKLQGANQVWISNWRVVNKTFAELRKKLKFVVPREIIRVGQVG
ncbi:uncharacterized protein LOC118439419 [Folsomia candida]|uniref:Uncharacterized protein n=1 Tax=Folsomia candida TaxID=158441 RepID=A0A226D4R2_FOLCA|nr:uncharacterized protein LOC118439419 [Folsomia candida]OXA40060.1 hypothetical protein Fcan01_25157 [Folsomia candida]